MEQNEIENKLHSLISVDEETWINIDAALNKAWIAGYRATHAIADSPEGKIEELEKEVEELERDNANLKNEVDSLNDQIGVLKSEGADSADEASDQALANILAGRGYLGILTRCDTLNVGE